jgi:hypothetical protein
MRWFWDVYWPIIVIIALALGLTAQFVWKMVYFPEPIVPVIIELVIIWVIVGVAVWGELREKTGY